MSVRGGVRNLGKASSQGIQHAVQVDLMQDTVADLTRTLEGVDAVVCAAGFVPGNPLKWKQEAHAVRPCYVAARNAGAMQLS